MQGQEAIEAEGGGKMSEEWLFHVYDSDENRTVGGIQVIDNKAVLVGDPYDLVGMCRKWREVQWKGREADTANAATVIDFQLSLSDQRDATPDTSAAAPSTAPKPTVPIWMWPGSGRF